MSILELGDGCLKYWRQTGTTSWEETTLTISWSILLRDSFAKENGVDLRKDRMALQRREEVKGKRRSCPHLRPPASTCPLSPSMQTGPFI